MTGAEAEIDADDRERIRLVAAAHGALNVRVFGSVALGESVDGSELGLIVDMADDRNLFDLIRLSEELKKMLGVEVDVQTEKSLSPYLRSQILAEAVAL